MTDDGYTYPEAFRLLRYRSDQSGLQEFIWNSRDGVAPTEITMTDGTAGRRLIRTVLADAVEPRRPDYHPGSTERVIIDLDPARALGGIEHLAAWLWASDSVHGRRVRENFPTMNGFRIYLEELHVDATVDGGVPTVVSATESGFTLRTVA